MPHRRMLCYALILPWLIPLQAHGAGGKQHVYRHHQAEYAIKVAQRECKPLFVHVVPDTGSVGRHIKRFYGPDSPISAELLDRVVVLVMPADKYPHLRDQLGIDGKGGVRTLSPYSLEFSDFGSTATTRLEGGIRTIKEEQQLNRREWEIGREGAWEVVRSQASAHRTVTIFLPGPWGTCYPMKVYISEACCSLQPQGRIYGTSKIVQYEVDAPPEVLIPQLEIAVRYFDTYGREELPAALAREDATPMELIGGLRFIETRGLTGYESQIQEWLTSRIESPLAREVYEACIDALIATSQSQATTARFLARVAIRDEPLPSSGYCRKAIARLGPPAFDELLYLIADAESGAERSRLAIFFSLAPPASAFPPRCLSGVKRRRTNSRRCWRNGARRSSPSPCHSPVWRSQVDTACGDPCIAHC